MLALPTPYGSNASSFAHLTLTVLDQLDEASAKEAMMEFGCQEQYADKAVSCLRHSGRYDCYLQRSWVVGAWKSGEVQRHFSEIGLHFHINEFHPPLQ